MGPKTRQTNTRYRVKQTSTPLKEGDAIHSFLSLKNISSVKVLRKRTITLTESSYTLKNKTKRISTTSRRSEQKFSIGSKKYNSKPRKDTPLKPRTSFMTGLSTENPKRLKFSQISDTLDILNSFENESSSSFGEALYDESELEITGDPAENTINGRNVPRDTWSTLITSGDTDEVDGIKMLCKTSNPQIYSVSEGNISSDDIKHSLQTRVISELTMDTSSSLETCRRQGSSSLLPPSLKFSSSEDILSEGSVAGYLERDINLEPLCILSKNTKNIGDTKFEAVIENYCAFNRSTSWIEVQVDNSVVKEADYANKCISPNPYASHDPEFTLEKNISSSDAQKDNILNDKDENTKETVNEGKFGDHLQHNATMLDNQTKRKYYERNFDILPSKVTLERKSSESLNSANDCTLAILERKRKDIFKKPLPVKDNNAKKKSKGRRKKAKDVESPSLEHYTKKESTEVSTKSTVMNKFPIDVSHANIFDDASNDVVTIPYTRQDSELRLEKDTPSCDLPKAPILDTKNERTNMTVSDGKFDDHLQHNAIAVNVQTKRKHYKRRDEIVPLREFSGMRPSKSQDSVKGFSIDSDRKIKGTSKKLLPAKKNKAKKKSKVRQKKMKDLRSPNLKPCTVRKGREVKKGNGKFTHPSTSTPLINSNLVIERFAAPLEDISPLGTLKENILMGYEVDDLHIKRTSICKTYGRRKSQLSHRWDSFSRKSRNYSRIVKEDNYKEESPKLKRVLPRNQIVLFKTPPSYSLSEIPTDDILKSRDESMKTRKKTSEFRDTNEKDETSTKWNECTKIRQLADHFKEISKYSLIVENKRRNKK